MQIGVSNTTVGLTYILSTLKRSGLIVIGDSVGFGVTVGVAVGSGVTFGVAVGLGVTFGVAVGLGVTFGVAVGLGVTFEVAVGLGVTFGVAVGFAVTLGVEVGLGVILTLGFFFKISAGLSLLLPGKVPEIERLRSVLFPFGKEYSNTGRASSKISRTPVKVFQERFM